MFDRFFNRDNLKDFMKLVLVLVTAYFLVTEVITKPREDIREIKCRQDVLDKQNEKLMALLSELIS